MADRGDPVSGNGKTGTLVARRLLASDDYQEWLRYRISTKTLDKEIEKMLWSFAYPKPASEVHVVNGPDLSNLSVNDLRQQLFALEKMLGELDGAGDTH